ASTKSAFAVAIQHHANHIIALAPFGQLWHELVDHGFRQRVQGLRRIQLRVSDNMAAVSQLLGQYNRWRLRSARLVGTHRITSPSRSASTRRATIKRMISLVPSRI